MMIDPTSKGIKGLIPISEALFQMKCISRNQIVTALRKYLLSLKGAWRLTAPSIVKRVRFAENESELKREVFQALLMTGGIDSFVVDPIEKVAFSILPSSWWLLTDGITDTHKMLYEGIFYNRGAKIKTLEHDLRNKPIFISGSSLNKFLKIRPPCQGNLIKFGQHIISNHQKSSSAKKMTKAEFTKSLKQYSPAISGRQASAVWSAVVPDNWKQPGRKS